MTVTPKMLERIARLERELDEATGAGDAAFNDGDYYAAAIYDESAHEIRLELQELRRA